MGGCCSNGRVPSVRNSSSFARITDSILQMRQPTVELQEETVEMLVEEKMEEAYQWYLTSVKRLLDWKEPALKKEEFEESIGKLLEQAKNYFRTLFMQGTTGENVPFSHIEASEKSLMHFCKSDFALFSYCNVFKSFTICSGLKRELVKSHSSKAKVLKLYNRSAQGRYADRCRKDLELLLTLLGRCRSQQEVTCKLEVQLAMDREILARKLAKAQEKARTQMSEVFDGSGEGLLDKSPVTMSMLHSHASVMDVITRVIESAPESSNQSYILTGSLGSLRDPYVLKKHSSETPPKREDSANESCSSLQSDLNSPLALEISRQSRVLCMDRGPLQRLG